MKDKKQWRTRWFSRLKTQFIVAITISFALAVFLTAVVLVLSSGYFESLVRDRIEFDMDRLTEAFGHMEELIEVKELHPNDISRLEEIFDMYQDFNFQLYMAEKDDDSHDMLIDYIIYADETTSIDARYYENQHGLFVISASVNQMKIYVGIFFLAVMILFASIFVGCIFFFVGRKQRYLLEIENGLDILSGGELSHKIRIKGRDEITSVARNINQMSAALQEKIKQEKMAESMKKELIANISHDLRTPLTSITGFLTLIKDMKDKNSDTAEGYLDVALNKSTELSKLIGQLFDYVMLSNNQMVLNFETVDMAMVMRQSCFECKSLLEEDGFEVITELDGDPVMVKVDTVRIMRVLDNLVENIRKYASKDIPIKVRGYIHEEKYRIHVANGLKANANIKRDVFTRYFTSNRADQKSTGLGLAICREIIHLHDGTINAAIADGTFEIVFDLPQA